MRSCPFPEPNDLVKTMNMRIHRVIPVLNIEGGHFHDIELYPVRCILFQIIFCKYFILLHTVPVFVRSKGSLFFDSDDGKMQT